MSTGQNGKGSAPRNIGPRFKENYDSIRWKPEYRVVHDNDGHAFVVRADEVAVFEHWVAAMEGKRHMPADFTPVQIDCVENLRFTGWREEEDR